jgi:uncharacterized protein YjbI with pentapeptide repeats
MIGDNLRGYFLIWINFGPSLARIGSNWDENAGNFDSLTAGYLEYRMANQEHLAELHKGVESWNRWRHADLELRPDLREADLADAKLCGAYLVNCNLYGANLRGADLSSRARYPRQ